MITAVADTHVCVWYFEGNPRLSIAAKAFIDTTVNAGNEIAVSSITLVELTYLVEKGRIPASRFTQLTIEMSSQETMFVEIPVDLRVARALSRVNATQVPDMPDRIVAATAVYLNVPVISRDGKIRLSNIQTIW